MLSHLKNNEGKIRFSIIWMTVIAFVFVTIFFYALVQMTDGMPGFSAFHEVLQDIWSWLSRPFKKTI